ncbi:MAG: hypothetical protein J6Q59_04550 [Paludibacteraceae bacterium]|nr:hypothetical protein [Paludibacteraceae bacterium]
MALSGAKLAGGNPANNRVKNDFYATNPEAVEALLKREKFDGLKFLEPCVGAGHIAEVIKKHFPEATVDCIDIEYRGYAGTVTTDFLQLKTDKKYNAIITNPPYSLALEFIEKSMQLIEREGKIAMFLKLQFLEGEKRKKFFEKFPPATIYVFRKRMATWKNGEPKDAHGKNWATTMCHAWYVWEAGKPPVAPIIKWI